MPTTTMPSEQVQVPALYREAAVVDGSLDAEQRTFDIVWTAGAEVPRIDWWTGERYVEVLEVAEKSIRLDRLKSGRVPVLDSHSRWSLTSVLGVVDGKSVKLAGGEGRCTVRMSQREDVAPIIADIRDRIIGNVSPGYITHSYREEIRDGTLYRIATDWEPIEISFVPVGADPNAGMRSALATYPCRVLRAPTMNHAALARMRMHEAALKR